MHIFILKIIRLLYKNYKPIIFLPILPAVSNIEVNKLLDCVDSGSNTGIAD